MMQRYDKIFCWAIPKSGFFVYDIAPKRELPDDIGTPLPELCGTDGVDTIAHGNDGIEVVEQCVASHLSCTFLLNYRDFLGSCFLVQFLCVVYIFQMQSDIVKEIYFCIIFLAERFVLSMIIRIFAASVLAKPLNNAQIVRGVFCLYTFEYGESYSLYKTV